MSRSRMSKRLIGWLVFAPLACAGFYYLGFLRQSRRPVSLALEVAGKSTAVASSLGSTNLRKTFVTGRIVAGRDYGNADLSIHVVSQNGHGVLLEWAQNGFAGGISVLLFCERSSRRGTLFLSTILGQIARGSEFTQRTESKVKADFSASLRNDKQEGNCESKSNCNGRSRFLRFAAE
jgi:hypothetical protein